MFSKRHYEVIAEIIRGMDHPQPGEWLDDDLPEETVEFIAKAFAERFSQINPRFCKARFIDACKPK